MDGLSTSAREWTPGGSSATANDNIGSSNINNNDVWQTESDLKASAVKEFVPGQGWSAGSAAPKAGELFPLYVKSSKVFIICGILYLFSQNQESHPSPFE